MTEGRTADLALEALEPFGVDIMFTLNGGHIWPFYETARSTGMRIVDTRHEQTATWAAEAYSKLTRRPGLAVLTAGPGITNGISALTSAHFNGSPVVVLGGRAPQASWGSGALQEIDHVPIVATITKRSGTVTTPAESSRLVQEFAAAAVTPHRGPVFLDFPLDVLFSRQAAEVADRPPTPERLVAGAGADPDPEAVSRVAKAIAAASRPAMIVGSDVYWAGAWDSLRMAAERLQIPCYPNGMGRGCLAPEHPLSFSHTRGMLKKDADLVVVVGTPLDFRLSYGAFGSAEVIHIADSDEARSRHLATATSVSGDLDAILSQLASDGLPPQAHAEWIEALTESESSAIAGHRRLLDADSAPIKPPRVFGELARRLAEDAVIICDGGDFASYAGKYLEPSKPGCWLDTGPYGCLGNGPGYAIAARLARPSSQVVAILGDGAAGFSLMDVDSLVRHRLPVVMVVGNNGIWGLEKHPMKAIYGWDAACDLQAQTPYDAVVASLGGAGETVREPGEIGPALDRAFASGVPYLINVITDPADAYPRSTAL